MRFRDKGDLVTYLRRIWDQKTPTIIVLGSDQKYTLTNYEMKMNCKIFFLVVQLIVIKWKPIKWKQSLIWKQWSTK